MEYFEVMLESSKDEKYITNRRFSYTKVTLRVSLMTPGLVDTFPTSKGREATIKFLFR